MKEYTTEELNNIFETLPESLQKAISSVKTAERLEEIRKKFSLHIDQAGKLGKEVGFVLLGTLSIKDFVKSIQKSLEIDGGLAQKIAKEVEQEIFSEVRDSLKRITKKNDNNNFEESEELDRDKILKEIEGGEVLPQENKREVVVANNLNITPLTPSKSPSTKNNKAFLSGNVETQGQIPISSKEKIPTQKPEPEMFETKLEKETSSEKKETREEITRSTYKGGLDPYREPVE